MRRPPSASDGTGLHSERTWPLLPHPVHNSIDKECVCLISSSPQERAGQCGGINAEFAQKSCYATGLGLFLHLFGSVSSYVLKNTNLNALKLRSLASFNFTYVNHPFANSKQWFDLFLHTNFLTCQKLGNRKSTSRYLFRNSVKWVQRFFIDSWLASTLLCRWTLWCIGRIFLIPLGFRKVMNFKNSGLSSFFNKSATKFKENFFKP